jgi:hypothetical protein
MQYTFKPDDKISLAHVQYTFKPDDKISLELFLLYHQSYKVKVKSVLKSMYDYDIIL